MELMFRIYPLILNHSLGIEFKVSLLLKVLQLRNQLKPTNKPPPIAPEVFKKDLLPILVLIISILFFVRRCRLNSFLDPSIRSAPTYITTHGFINFII